jgi:sRNA-binding regulator protein Hfq
MKYTGQTGRSFNARFREHLRDFKNGYGKSRFAQHLLENRHAIGPMNDIMDTIYFTNKGRLMDAVESFYIFREIKLNNEINDRLTVKHIIILETIVREDPHRGIHDTCNTQ